MSNIEPQFAATVPEPEPNGVTATAMTLRERIIAADDIEAKLLEVQQWGVTVEVRGMSGSERAKFMGEFSDEEGTLDYASLYPSLIVKCIFDPETGLPVFTESDAEVINSKSGAVLEMLGREAVKLSGMDADATKAAKKRFPE